MTIRIVLKSGVTVDIKSANFELIRDEQDRVVNLKLQYVDQREKPIYMAFSEIAAVFEIGSETSEG